MRPWSVIGLLFFAVFGAACHRPAVEAQRATPQQSSELVVIDSLLWTQPDSALTRLIQCYDTVNDRHYANLLLAELLYKNYYEQTNRTELLKAVAHYDSLSCPFLAARAHYINGVGYYERDSVVLACEEYLKAVDYYTGECYRYTNSMRQHYMDYRAYWSNYQRTGLEEHFNAAAYHLKYLPIHIP